MAEETKERSEIKSSVNFAESVDESAEKKRASTASKRSSKRSSLRSSFFRLKSLSFRRSGGDRGADLDTLRGTYGPEFEGYAKINRAGGAGLSCGCFGGSSKDDKNEKIILIKGAYCFVFTKETDSSPKYAIALAHQKAKLQQPPSHGLHRVTVESSLGDIDWELHFETKPIADQFVLAFRKQAAIGEADEVRKRLGHDKLLNKRGSVKYAEAIALKKLGEQPEKKENVVLDDALNVEPMTATHGGY